MNIFVLNIWHVQGNTQRKERIWCSYMIISDALFRIINIWRECHYPDRWANPKLKKIELKNDLIIAIKLHIHLPGCLMNCKRHCLLFLYHAWLTLFMITSRLIQPSLIHYCEGNRGRLDSQWQLFRDGQLELKWLISVFCIQCSPCRRTRNVPYLSWCAWFWFTLDFGRHQSITQLHLGQFKTWPKKWHLSITLSLPGISTGHTSTTIQEGFLSNQLLLPPRKPRIPGQNPAGLRRKGSPWLIVAA